MIFSLKSYLGFSENLKMIYLTFDGLGPMALDSLNLSQSSRDLNDGRLGTLTAYGSWFHCSEIVLEKLCCHNLVLNAAFFILRPLFCSPF